MPNATTEDFRQTLLAVLDEAFSKPSQDWRYFTEPSAKSGYLGVLTGLTHEEAAQSVGGSSIAAQVQHVTFVLRVSSRLIEGEPETPDSEAWQDSWQVSQVDAESWNALVSGLHDAYEALRHAIQHSELSGFTALGNGIGAVAHIAYHLGAIKQKLNIIRSA